MDDRGGNGDKESQSDGASRRASERAAQERMSPARRQPTVVKSHLQAGRQARASQGGDQNCQERSTVDRQLHSLQAINRSLCGDEPSLNAVKEAADRKRWVI